MVVLMQSVHLYCLYSLSSLCVYIPLVVCVLTSVCTHHDYSNFCRYVCVHVSHFQNNHRRAKLTIKVLISSIIVQGECIFINNFGRAGSVQEPKLLNSRIIRVQEVFLLFVMLDTFLIRRSLPTLYIN